MYDGWKEWRKAHRTCPPLEHQCSRLHIHKGERNDNRLSIQPTHNLQSPPQNQHYLARPKFRLKQVSFHPMDRSDHRQLRPWRCQQDKVDRPESSDNARL